MQGFTVLSNFMSQNRPCTAACSGNIDNVMVPLFVTQNRAIIVQYELASV